ncbi:MAG: molybdopterin-guanine dinucleotide biosynthesis protein B [Betaproteobacteria bacterium]|jgi:molybdopterin-guanine dinucleotide biosynthesis protein B
MKTIGFIGYSNSGKTTLIEKLIPLLTARGLSVSAVKNAHHGFDMDRPGKDSYRYREAGASQVLIATSRRWALLTETPEGPAPLDTLLARLSPCDLVLVEGFKSEGEVPRIEVRRSTSTEPALFPRDPNVVAVAADYAVEGAAEHGLAMLQLNDPAAIAAFIVDRLRLG